MSDLISRQVAIEALANLTCVGIEEIKAQCDRSVADSEGWLGGIRDAAIELEALPSAEPEVIYCKDCKYSHMTIDGLCKYCDIWFPNERMYLDGKFFCASAEKRML